MRLIPVAIDQERLAALCRRHGIIELSLFGSVLRDDFRPDSDLDVLVQFQDGKTLTLDSYVQISDDLSSQFDGRPIDLVELRRLADPYRRHEILRTREIIYAAS